MPPSNPFDPFPALETRRLRLRAVTIEDAEDMLRVVTDPLVSRYFGKKPPAVVDEVRRKIAESDEALRDAKAVRWALADRETGAYLGGAGIWRWDRSHFRAEVGYELAASHWGRGL